MNNFLILLALALIASSCGFRKYVWFISIGYGTAIALIGVGLLVIFGSSLTVGTALQCVLLVVYGCRLAGYLIYRDVKTAYNRRMKGEVKSNEGVSPVAKVGIWVSASVLYVLQTSPVLFRLEGTRGTDVLSIVGLVISTAGLVLETTADLQKNRAKKANPKRFVDTGLFRLLRCRPSLHSVCSHQGSRCCTRRQSARASGPGPSPTGRHSPECAQESARQQYRSRSRLPPAARTRRPSHWERCR